MKNTLFFRIFFWNILFAPNKARLQRAVSAHAQCVGLRPQGGADDAVIWWRPVYSVVGCFRVPNCCFCSRKGINSAVVCVVCVQSWLVCCWGPVWEAISPHRWGEDQIRYWTPASWGECRVWLYRVLHLSLFTLCVPGNKPQCSWVNDRFLFWGEIFSGCSTEVRDVLTKSHLPSFF